MAPEQPHDGGSDDQPPDRPDDLEEQQRIKDDEVLEREGLETALMEHDESEAGEDIHHAG
jgi:hypothetical protein